MPTRKGSAPDPERDLGDQGETYHAGKRTTRSEKLRVEIEANLCATSEFETKKKPLKEALDAKTESLRQVS